MLEITELLEITVFLVMSESQKCQTFPVLALGGGGGEELAPLTLIWLVLTQANTTNSKHAS